MIGERPGGGYMINCYFEDLAQTESRVTEDVNAQRGQAQSRPSEASGAVDENSLYTKGKSTSQSPKITMPRYPRAHYLSVR